MPAAGGAPSVRSGLSYSPIVIVVVWSLSAVSTPCWTRRASDQREDHRHTYCVFIADLSQNCSLNLARRTKKSRNEPEKLLSGDLQLQVRWAWETIKKCSWWERQCLTDSNLEMVTRSRMMLHPRDQCKHPPASKAARWEINELHETLDLFGDYCHWLWTR